MTSKKFIPFRIDVSNRIPAPVQAKKTAQPKRVLAVQSNSNSSRTPEGSTKPARQSVKPTAKQTVTRTTATISEQIANQPNQAKLVDHTSGNQNSSATMRTFGKHLRADAAHLGIETRRAMELSTIAVRLFHVTTNTIQATLKDLVSCRHWIQKYRSEGAVDRRIPQLGNEISLTTQQLFNDGKYLAETRQRLADDANIVTYESHLITADAVARLKINIESIERIIAAYRDTVLVASRPLSVRIINRLQLSKMSLTINQQQFAELSKIITILREQARSRQFAEKTNLKHTAPQQSKTDHSPKGLLKRLFGSKAKPKPHPE